MVDAQQMHERCLKVVDVNWILDDVVTEIVGLAVTDSRLDASASHPDRKTLGMMIATVVRLGQFTLRVIRTAEFATPNDQRVVQHASLLQIQNQGSRSTIRVPTLTLDSCWQIVMLIPSAMIQLNKLHTLLC